MPFKNEINKKQKVGRNKAFFVRFLSSIVDLSSIKNNVQ